MNYKLVNASNDNYDTLVKYKLATVLEYATNLEQEELDKICNYVNNEVKEQLNNYKLIVVDETIVGCLLVKDYDNGVLLDEIFIEENCRNFGIGTQILNNVLSENNIVYLYVYKENAKAYKLYVKMGFVIILETDTRYFMKYEK